MGLFKPIWMTGDASKQKKALDAVNKIKDDATLKQIAIKAPLDGVKSAAISGIGDENVLAEIYFDGSVQNSSAALTLLSELRDPAVIERIVLEEAKRNFYLCAAKKQIPPELARRLILSDSFSITVDRDGVMNNFAYELLVKSIRALETAGDVEKIAAKFAGFTEVAKLCGLRRDELDGAVGYEYVCPTCGGAVRYRISETANARGDVVTEGAFICGCGRLKTIFFERDFEKRALREAPENEPLVYCSCCGLVRNKALLAYPTAEQAGECRKNSGGYKHDYIPVYIARE